MDGSTDYKETEKAEVIKVDVAKLYGFWQSSQKEPKNLHRPQIEIYLKKIAEGEKLKPIIFEQMNVGDEGEVYVRTLDGRHRLAASFEAQTGTIDVLKTDLAVTVKEMLGL